MRKWQGKSSVLRDLLSSASKNPSSRKKETKLNKLKDALGDANDKIVVENEKADEALQAMIREETLRKAQEARMKVEREMRERWERSEKIRVI